MAEIYLRSQNRKLWPLQCKTQAMYVFDKSCGHDLTPPKLVKESAAAIAKPIAKILNASVDQGCYPTA